MMSPLFEHHHLDGSEHREAPRACPNQLGGRGTRDEVPYVRHPIRTTGEYLFDRGLRVEVQTELATVRDEVGRKPKRVIRRGGAFNDTRDPTVGHVHEMPEGLEKRRLIVHPLIEQLGSKPL